MNLFDSISLLPILQPWLLALLFAGVVGLSLLGPGNRELSPWRRRTLTLVRLAAVAVALIAALRPGLVKTTERQQAGVLMFLLDCSRSMDLPHLKDDSTRFQAMRAMVKENQSRFDQLAQEKIDVRFFGFDNRSWPLEIGPEGALLPDEPTGTETDLAAPIFETGIQSRGQRLIGMFLASDGMQTSVAPEVELSQAIETLRDLELPLYSLLFGLPGDSGQLADVSVRNFAQEHVVNVKNRLNASATISARGYANEDIRVELVLIDRDGNEQVVGDPVFIRPKTALEENRVTLQYTPTEPGEFRIKVRAAAMPGELALRNNELDAFLSVNDKGMRVLYLNGSLGFEQASLRRSLATADFIEIDFRLLIPGGRASTREALAHAFADPTYDIFVLDDVDASLLQQPNESVRPIDVLADAVEGGKGLLMIGGTHSFGAGGYAGTRLADVLPVKMSPSEQQPFGEDVRRELHINREVKLIPTRDHYLTRLGEGGLAAWSRLPPLSGANRIDRLKNNAVVLLRSDDEAKHPVLVESNVGGRVIAFAGDSTRRWNFFRVDNDPSQRTFKQEYDQFWRQIILRLAFWDSKTGESISIDLPQRRYGSRQKIRFGVSAQNVQGATITDAQYQAILSGPDGSQTPVTVRSSGGESFGEIDPDLVAAAGLYTIKATGLRQEISLGSTERDFVVMDRDREKSNPAADPELLTRLSNETRDYGGRMMQPQQLADLLDDLIENPPVEKIEVPTTWRIGETSLDSTIFVLLFAGLVGTEWFLRKKWELV